MKTFTATIALGAALLSVGACKQAGDGNTAADTQTSEAQKAAGGLGLGLPVCERIVNALGGRMWAAHRDGGGSEFGFALPIAPSPGEGD